MISGSLYALIKEKWRLVGPLTHTLRRGEIAFHYPGEFHWVKANGKIAPNLIVISFSCTDPAMEFFRGKILHLEETERRLLAGIIAEAGSFLEGRLDDPYQTSLADQKRYIPCLWSAYPPSFRRTSPQPLPA